MRTRTIAGRGPAWIITLGILLAAGPVAAATLTCGTGSGLAGQTVTVSLTASDLTGLGVKSYQFDVGYAANVVTATGVSTASTLTGTAGWATPTFNVTPGRIRVSAAGTTALTGAGVLVKLTFILDPSLLNGSSTTLTLSNALFNEGTPAVTTSNGSITITATPQVTVSPNTGEIAVGQTLQFTLSGSVTLPVAWSTTNASVATINSSGLLTAVGPGAVRVNALDAASRADQSDGDILVRVATVKVLTGSGPLGGTVSIPVTTASLTGFNVKAGQFQVSWDNRYLTLGSATTGPTSMLNGYGSFVYGVQATGFTSVATVAFSGTTPLVGADTLFVLNFNVNPTNYGTIGLTLLSALFNEDLPALRVSGTVSIPSPTTFSLSPNTVTLLATQTQQFTTSGTVVLPITWTSADTNVARISASGLLTAKTGGTTIVKAVDAVAGTALSGTITVYDLAFSVGSIIAAPGAVAHVPIVVDRDLTPLNLRAVEFTLGWSPTYITTVTPTNSGQFSTWGAPTVKALTNAVRVVDAGAAKLGPFSVIEYIDIATSAATPNGTDIPLTLTGVILNEGRPIPLVSNGTLKIRTGSTDVAPGEGLELAFAPAAPNPASEHARFAFTLPAAGAEGGRARLDLFGAGGRRIRRLVDDALGAGRHEVTWDLRAEDGSRVGAGIYFARLEWAGQQLERRITVLR